MIARNFDSHSAYILDSAILNKGLGRAVQKAAKTSLLAAVGIAAMMLVDRPACAAIDAYSTAVNADSPYAYYRFGENSGTALTDFSGNGRDGTYTNVPSLGQAGYAPAGLSGDSAASFNGTSHYAALNNISSFGSELDNFSMEVVFKTTATTSSTLAGEINTGTSVALQITLNQNQNGGTAAGYTRFFLRSNDGKYLSASISNAAIYDGDYHHVAFSFSQSTMAFDVFVDGVAQAVLLDTRNTLNATTGTFADFNVNPTVGALNNRGSIGGYGAATIDELALYAATLSGADVAEHYAALTAVPEPASLGLVGFAAGMMILRGRRPR